MVMLKTVCENQEWAFWVKPGDTVYYLQSRYEEKDQVKAAGFSWHKERRIWWTKDVDKAAKLAEFSQDKSGWGAELLAIKMHHTVSLAGSKKASTETVFPKPEGQEYMPFQKAGIEYMMHRNSTLLADEMGLGKTIQAIGLVNADDSIKTILVICPATLKLNWMREMEKWLVVKRRIGIANTKICPMPEDGFDVVITNYESVPKINPKLSGITWDLLVVDEAHYLKSQKTLRYKAIAGGERGESEYKRIPARRRVYTTGTPVVNCPAELWPLISAVDPEKWNKDTFWYYHKRFCAVTRNRYGMDFGGAASPERLGELQELLRSRCMVRRLKADVLTELPPKIRQVVELEWDESDGVARAAVEHGRAAQRGVDTEEFQAAAVAVELAKAEDNIDAYRAAVEAIGEKGKFAFDEMARVRSETAQAKIPYAIEYLEEMLEVTPKIVVFAHHIKVLEALRNKWPLESMAIWGDIPLAERQQAVDRFQTDPTCKLALVGIKAGGLGITLTAASHVVVLELPWTPGDLSQAEDRCIVENSLVFCLRSDYIKDMGLIKIQDVRVGDMMLTHKGRYKRVSAIHNHEHRGMVTRIDYVGWNEPLASTYDHKIFVKRDGKNVWLEAHELLPSDSMAFPKQKNYKELKFVAVKDEWRIYKDGEKKIFCSMESCEQQIEARGLCRVHYRELLKEEERPKKPIQINSRYVRLPDVIQITDEWLYLFGWFVAEGFSSLLPGKSKFVSFSGHEREKDILNKIAKVLDVLGIRSNIYTKDMQHGIEMRSYSGELALWFRDWFGHGAKNKVLPEEIMNLPPHQACVFLRGYTDGDGYQRGKQVEWVSASSILCYQICLLTIRSGFIPTMRNGSIKSGSHWVGGYTKFGNSCNKRLNDQDDDYVYRPIQKVETKNEKVMVYDLTVEDDHSFTVGFATVHNCHRIGQTDTVNVYHLVLRDSIDVNMARTIIEKQRICDATLDVIVAAEPVIPSERESSATRSITRKQIEEQAQHITQGEIEAIHDCLKNLSAMDTDFARSENNMGFNKIDCRIGHELAERFELTPKQAVLGRRIAKKYVRQLPVDMYSKAMGKEVDGVKA